MKLCDWFQASRRSSVTTSPVNWRDILHTAVYNRIHRVECSWEDYWDPIWAHETIALLERAPNSATAIDIADEAMKKREEPLIDRRDYERMWESEMCWS